MSNSHRWDLRNGDAGCTRQTKHKHTKQKETKHKPAQDTKECKKKTTPHAPPPLRLRLRLARLHHPLLLALAIPIRKKKLRGHVARLRAHAALRAVRGERAHVIRRTCCLHTRGSDVSTQSDALEGNSVILRGHVCSYCVKPDILRVHARRDISCFHVRSHVARLRAVRLAPAVARRKSFSRIKYTLQVSKSI